MKRYFKAINFILIGFLSISILSCDKIEGPYGNGNLGSGGGSDTSVQIIRKILIEDFTGHTCGNCPRAAEALHQIHDLYGNQIVSIAVHAGFFAAPSGTHYSDDYRTQVGNELDQFFGNSSAGLPNGLVNRKSYDLLTILQYTDWASKASEWINSAPDAFITVDPTYSSSDRSLSITANTQILQNIDETLNIVYYLTEDSILSSQKDYDLPSPSLIEDYYHRHMLRGSMNGTWGEQLGEGVSYTENTQINTSANFTIPTDWNAEKVAVVAVVYRAATKEIIQVEEKKINL